MPSTDDVITLGGPRRQFEHERDEAIENLFHAEYQELVRSAFALVGDGDQAERVATRAFIDLRRHWRRVGDPREAPLYLRSAVTKLANESGDAAPNRAVSARTSDQAPAVDIERRWREFDSLRERTRTVRRRDLIAAAAAAAVVAAAAFVSLAGHRPASNPLPAPSPVTQYAGAIVARFELSGVISVVGNADQAWAIRKVSQPSTIEQPAASTRYQLVALDPRTNTVRYQVNLGRQPRAIAAGAGRVWLTTPSGQAAGQIVGIDPGSGRAVQTLHLRAGHCTQLSFSSRYLYAACTARPAGTGLWAVNPVTERARLLGTPVHGFVTSLVATPHAVWYVGGLSRISGLAHVAARLTTAEQVTAGGLGYYNLSPGTGGLAYDARSIWALGSQERLVRIDATTGNVVRRYTYREYDQARSGSLEFLTAADGWLWFLDNGNPLSSVLRISEATGRPAGGVPILPGSCGQSPCSLIFSTPGSIWVPTAQLLIRIDPSALRPGAPANLLDADSPTTWLIGRRGMTGLSHCPPLGPFAAPPPMAPLPSGPRRACTGGT